MNKGQDREELTAEESAALLAQTTEACKVFSTMCAMIAERFGPRATCMASLEIAARLNAAVIGNATQRGADGVSMQRAIVELFESLLDAHQISYSEFSAEFAKRKTQNASVGGA